MNWREWAENQLQARGLFPDQAKAVIDIAAASAENESMASRWSDSVDGYPETMKSVLWMSIKTHALEWIDTNCPQAWFRPMLKG